MMKMSTILLPGVILLSPLAVAHASLENNAGGTVRPIEPARLDTRRFTGLRVSGRVFYAELDAGAGVDAGYEEAAENEAPIEGEEEAYAEDGGEPADYEEEEILDEQETEAVGEGGEAAEEAEGAAYDGADPNYDESGAPKTEGGAESGVYEQEEAVSQAFEDEPPDQPYDTDAGYADAPDPYYDDGGSPVDDGESPAQPLVSPFGAIGSGTGE
ncbi:MAG: hypothetical protein U9R74_18135 [Pseudomonadota bacterium]|nr:hypothetical protein [Pseudomonadota bacterium]